MASRAVFVTFLGTNPYLECNYVLEENKKVENVRFIQEALVRLLYNNFRERDRILVFLTGEARRRNWLDREENGSPVPGLQSRFKALGIHHLVRDIAIPDGTTSNELWKIFSLVFDQIEEGDRVIFDITHGFRSLPMLGIVLLNYARILKNITIDGIYYGAFDVLGPVWQVRDMPPAERNAPIFNLTNFATLLIWASGVQEFIRHGNPASIAELLERDARPRLKEYRGRDPAAKIWSCAASYLNKVGIQIATNRGLDIVKGDAFCELHGFLEKCEELDDLPPAFRPLINRIKNKVTPFEKNEPANCLQAVGWCIEHNLVQQGITMLQEGAITLVANQHGLDWKNKEDRGLISSAVNVLNQKKACEQWDKKLRGNEELVKAIQSDSFIQEIAPTFDSLSKARNDINHAGFTQPKKAENLSKILEKAYKKIRFTWNVFGNVTENNFS